MKKFTLALISVLLLALFSGVKATNYYVNYASTGNNDGTSWTDAFTDLQSALGVATAGDTVFVAKGVYHPDASLQSATFLLNVNVKIFGGFDGTEDPIDQSALDARDFYTNETILSGDLNEDDSTFTNLSDNSYHVVSGNALDATTELDGFTISGGSASSGTTRGGGIILTSSSPILRNLNIHHNSCTYRGGAIYLLTSSPQIINTSIYSNKADSWNGGVYSNTSSYPSFVNTIIYGNIGTYPNNDDIYNGSSIPTFSYCIVGHSGGSSSWNTGLGSDLGNNLDVNPSLISAATGNCQLLFVSDALNAGNGIDGNNIGQYQGAGQVYSDILYVKGDAAGLNDGTSWTDAYTTIYDALNNAVAGQAIYVAAGTYTPEPGDRYNTIQLKSDISVIGGFAGNELNIDVATFASRDFYANASVLSGDFNGDDDGFLNVDDNATHVLTASFVSGMILDGFSITGGYCVDDTVLAYGAGIYLTSSSISINNCNFYSNYAVQGGAAYIYQCSPRFTNTTITNNKATSQAGGCYSYYYGYPVYKNCIIWDNKASSYANLYDATLSESYFSYSDVQGSQGSTYWVSPFGTDQGNNIDANPLLKNPAHGDVRLINGSPAINAGNMIQGNNMGQYQGAGENPPTPAYVKSDATGNNDGTSWTDAFTDLGAAIEMAQPFQEIYVARGIYSPAADSVSFMLKNELTIYGGFEGTEVVDSAIIADRDFVANETILSGDLNSNDNGFANNEENVWHIVKAISLNETAILDGFTISGGNTTYDPSSIDGGGLYIYGGNPVFYNLKIAQNYSSGNGGGTYVYASDPVFKNVLFENNYGNYGGAAYTYYYSNPDFYNTTFAYNNAYRSGAVYSYYYAANTFVNVLSWGNTQTYYATIYNGTGCSSQFAYCDIEYAGGSTAWVATFGTDNGNNIEDDPIFTDVSSRDFSYYEVSPCIGTGYSVHGPNIGHYQGAGKLLPAITTDATAIDFPSVVLGNYTNEIEFTIEGSSISSDIVITAGEGFDLSLTIGNFTGNTDTLVISPSADIVPLTSFFVRFRPLQAIAYSDSLHISCGPMYSTKYHLSGLGIQGATVEISMDQLDFGEVVVGDTSYEESFYISGFDVVGDITINAPANYLLSFTSGDYSGYSSQLAIPFTGAIVDPTYVYVSFNPQTAGNLDNSLVIATDDAVFQYINVYGTGVEPGIYVEGDFTDFGTLNVGESSSFQYVYTGGYDLSEDLYVVIPEGFSLYSYTCNCIPNGDTLVIFQDMGIADYSTIYIDFSPTIAGAYYDSVKFFSSGFDTIYKVVYGNALAVPYISTSESGIYVGNAPVGGEGIEYSYFIEGNYLTDDITIVAPANFEITLTAGDYSGNTDTIILSQVGGVVDPTEIFFRLVPVAEQFYNGNIMHSSPGANNNTVYVYGYGVIPLFEVYESYIDFGAVSVGASSADSYIDIYGDNLVRDIVIVAPEGFEITMDYGNYTGQDTIVIPFDGSGFIYETIYARFTPTQGITYFDSLKIYSYTDTFYVTMTGQGVLTPYITLGSPSYLDFGSVLKGTTSAEMSYTVEAGNLTSDLMLTLQGDFEMSLTSGVYSGEDTLYISPVSGTIDPTTVFVRFNPSYIGTNTSYIYHEATDATTQSKMVTGVGTAPPRLYVKADATGDNDGTSWDNAFTNLQDAFNNSNTGDTILVAYGTYTPSTYDRYESFYIRNGIKYYGGFNGTEDPIDQSAIDNRDFINNETILSGDINNDDYDWSNMTDNSYHVVIASADVYGSMGPQTIFDGFTIQGGNSDGAVNSGNERGGGIKIEAAYNDYCTVTFKNLILDHNQARDGGAVSLDAVTAYGDASPSFENVVFSNNKATWGGGAIHSFGGIGDANPTFTNVQFLNNTATYYGGAVYNYGYEYPGYIGGNASPVFTGALFVGNEAPYGGSAFYNQAGQDATGTVNDVNGYTAPVFINTTFMDNGADVMTNDLQFGQCNVTLTNTIFWNLNYNEIENINGASISADHCIIEGSGGSATWDTNLGTDNGNNYDADPTFVDYYGGDYRLLTGSPALNTGDATNGINIGYWQEAGYSGPIIYTEGNNLSFGLVNVGTVSAELSFTVSGINLTEDLMIVSPANFNISTVSGNYSGNTDTIILSPSSGSVSSTIIYVVFEPDAANTYSGQILNTSTGATSRIINVSGQGYLPPEIFVDINATGNNDGSSWQDAYNSLQTALSVSSYGDYIYVADGTYKPSSSIRSSSFVLRDGIKIYGGFAGTEYPITENVINSRDFQLNRTILSGDLSGNDNGLAYNTENSYHVVTADADNYYSVTSATLLDGFTIRGGNANGSTTYDYNVGGGIFLNSSYYGDASPTLKNLVIRENSAQDGAGIMIKANGTSAYINPSIQLVNFTDNYASRNGGGMFVNAAFGVCEPILDSLQFYSNFASYYGGAIYNEATQYGGSGGECRPVFYEILLSGNSAGITGSAVYNQAGNDQPDPYTDFYGYCYPKFMSTTFMNHSYDVMTSNQELGACSVEMQDVIMWDESANEILNINYPTVEFANCLVNGSGGSSLWNNNFGVDMGNNLDEDPLFVDYTNADYRLQIGSPAIGTGYTGNNIGYYQGQAYDGPILSVSAAAFDFGTIGINTTSIELLYIVNASNLSTDLVIEAPQGFQISTVYGDYSGNTSLITLSPTGGIIPDTTIYVRFAPTIEQYYSGIITHSVNDSVYYSVFVEGTGSGPIITLSQTQLDFGDIAIGDFSTQQYYHLDAQYLSDDLIITAPDGIQLSTVTEDYSGNTDTIIVSPTYGIIDNKFIYVRFAPETAGILDDTVLHISTGATTQIVRVTGNGIIPPMSFVNDDATGANDGSSWADAYTDLQDALTNAVDGQFIYVAGGTYRPDQSDRSVSFVLKDNVKILGGFEGTEYPITASVVQNRNFDANTSVLSGDIDQNDGSGDITGNSYHVVLVNPEITGGITQNSVLDGFTISGGNADGVEADNTDKGAGLLIVGGPFMSSDPTIRNINFENNKAYSGGALSIKANSADGTCYPIISNSMFENNTAVFGGAVYVEADFGSCSPFINFVEFRGNTASYGGAVSTKAISSSFSSGGYCAPAIGNALFYNNTATFGSAIYNNSGAPSYFGTVEMILFNTTLVENNGLAIRNLMTSGSCTLNLINVISWNTGFAEIINENGAYTTIQNCLMEGLWDYGIWNYEYGENYGNNVNGNPLFIDMEAGDVSLNIASPALNTGDSNYGINIGYWQEAGIPGPAIFVNSIYDGSFGLVKIGEASTEQDFTVSGIYLEDNITINAPAGFEITLNSGVYSGNTSQIILAHSGGTVDETTVYVRFAPINSDYVYDTVWMTSSGAYPAIFEVNGQGATGPVLEEITEAYVCSAQTNGQLTINILDDDYYIGYVVLEATSSNNSIVNTSTIYFDGYWNYRTMYFDVLGAGTTTITVVATSSSGLTDTISFDLTVGDVVYFTDYVLGCYGDQIWLTDGLTVEQPGLYYDTVASYFGCDSIITWNVAFQDSFPDPFAESYHIQDNEVVPLYIADSTVNYMYLDIYDQYGNYIYGDQVTSIVLDGPQLGEVEGLQYSISINYSQSNCYFYDHFTVTVWPNGVSESGKPKSDIRIYPNPTKEFFNVEVTSESQEPYELSISDITGRVVYSENQISSLTNKKVDISDLPSGAYSVTILEKDISRTFRIIKQ